MSGAATPNKACVYMRQSPFSIKGKEARQWLVNPSQPDLGENLHCFACHLCQQLEGMTQLSRQGVTIGCGVKSTGLSRAKQGNQLGKAKVALPGHHAKGQQHLRWLR